MPGIICHLFCTTNGKAYVGQTWDTLENRWEQHVKASRCKRRYLIHDAIRKHGPDSFDRTTLISGLQTQKEMDDAEIYWGEFFDVLAPNGYSLRLGQSRGKTSDVTKKLLSSKLKGQKRTAEQNERNRQVQLGKKRTSEQRERYRVSKLGKKNSFYGKKHTKEWCEEHSQKMTGRGNGMFGKKQSISAVEN